MEPVVDDCASRQNLRALNSPHQGVLKQSDLKTQEEQEDTGDTEDRRQTRQGSSFIKKEKKKKRERDHRHWREASVVEVVGAVDLPLQLSILVLFLFHTSLGVRPLVARSNI